jgi:hypothetical protein
MPISSSGHPKNADPPVSFTDAGIVNDWRRENAKACSPIFFSLDFSSNVTFDKELDIAKQRSPRISTDDGIVISLNPQA